MSNFKNDEFWRSAAARLRQGVQNIYKEAKWTGADGFKRAATDYISAETNKIGPAYLRRVPEALRISLGKGPIENQIKDVVLGATQLMLSLYYTQLDKEMESV